MVSAVVFDLDGTLMCLPVNWEALFEEFKQIMHVDVVRPIVDTVSKVNEKTRQEVFAAWDKAETAIYDRATSCGDGAKLYQEYQNKPKALVTLQGKAVVKLILQKFHLSFDAIVTREDSLFRSEQLRIAAEKLNVPLKNVLFIGNADSDEEAALKVGCKFARVIGA